MQTQHALSRLEVDVAPLKMWLRTHAHAHFLSGINLYSWAVGCESLTAVHAASGQDLSIDGQLGHGAQGIRSSHTTVPTANTHHVCVSVYRCNNAPHPPGPDVVLFVRCMTQCVYVFVDLGHQE